MPKAGLVAQRAAERDAAIVKNAHVQRELLTEIRLLREEMKTLRAGMGLLMRAQRDLGAYLKDHDPDFINAIATDFLANQNKPT